MAAVLACGGTAVLSHRSAAQLWALPARKAGKQPVDVSVERVCRRPGPTVRVHRVRALPTTETTTIHAIPITTPARTLLDLAEVAGTRELEHALAEAERSGLVRTERLAGLLARYPRRKGTPALRALLAEQHGPAFVRSDAEALLLALVRNAQLDPPHCNSRVEGHEVDFLWPRSRLIVEVDGRAFHTSALRSSATGNGMPNSPPPDIG